MKKNDQDADLKSAIKRIKQLIIDSEELLEESGFKSNALKSTNDQNIITTSNLKERIILMKKKLKNIQSEVEISLQKTEDNNLESKDDTSETDLTISNEWKE